MIEAYASSGLTRTSAGRSAYGRRSRARLDTGDVMTFVAPAVIAVEFKVVGRLFLSELLILGYLPFLLLNQHRRRLTRTESAVVVFGLVWLWAQVVTDLVRVSEFTDYSRGWLKIAFTLTTFIGFSLLIGNNRRRLVLAVVGALAGALIQYWANPSIFAAADLWKFAIGFPITLTAVLAACHPRIYQFPLASAGVLLLAGIINLQQGYRSLAGVCAIAAVFLAVQQVAADHKFADFRIRTTRVIAFSAVAVVLAVAFLSVYGYIARSGLLGPAAEAKYLRQASGKFGILIGGRPQTLAEIKAIEASPLIGHGSWARDKQYARAALPALVGAGYQPDEQARYELLSSETIPTHSFLLGAWVEAGILGAAFWAFILGVVATVIAALTNTRDRLSPIVAFFAIYLVWNALFSPYGAEQRFLVPLALVAVLVGQRLSQLETGTAESSKWRRARPVGARSAAGSGE